MKKLTLTKLKLMSVEDWKDRFNKEVSEGDIGYDWDGGHAYSYVDHPFMEDMSELENYNKDIYEEVNEYINEFLSYNESPPPCGITVNHKTQQVESSCGCYGDMEYSEGLEILEEIKNSVDISETNKKYLITEIK